MNTDHLKTTAISVRFANNAWNSITTPDVTGSKFHDVSNSGQNSSSTFFNYSEADDSTNNAGIQTTTTSPPVFNDAYMVETIVLSALFLISFIGNTATLIQMYRMRKRRSTINTLIVNLAIADLIVAFFCMAAEAFWTVTIQFLAGNAMCKILRYIQVFGFLLSTYITVVISLDRCCVILDPISRNKAPQRVRFMVGVSWLLSALFSVPQLFVFSVLRGPFKEDFYQCVDIASYPHPKYKWMYNIFCLFVQFMIPLGIMIAAYGLIFCTISRKSKEFRGNDSTSNIKDLGRGQVRNNLLKKAKRKALRMSIFIVIAFVVCWFPYYVLFTGNAFGQWKELSPSLMAGLSTMGLSNSMLNPIIYGAFQLCKVHRPSFSRKRFQTVLSTFTRTRGRERTRSLKTLERCQTQRST
ncbi:gonadotropin-releasing hormone receptor-like isoform X2 [Pecten maximus]|uniref:gonadotropin-releasing hormone receptor-like isoform X2 n=1 Tax=Pecten maximus TaxID=6579 RepID=UPI0014583314|nr:gonadotropin-releasing hormone receptor-like isoform X2 [Pecten maximus]